MESVMKDMSKPTVCMTRAPNAILFIICNTDHITSQPAAAAADAAAGCIAT